jgi:hypothetical protein
MSTAVVGVMEKSPREREKLDGIENWATLKIM